MAPPTTPRLKTPSDLGDNARKDMAATLARIEDVLTQK